MAKQTQDTECPTSPDVKHSVRYQRYFGLITVGMAPLFLFTLLIGRLDRLPLALQWILAAGAFGSTVYLLGLIVVPLTRELWLASNFYKPAHWWGFLVPLLNTVYLTFQATWGFAIVSGFLFLRGVGTTDPERALTDPFNDSWRYYIWSFLNAVPVLEIPQTLGWERPFRFTDHVNPALLLLYKLALVGPVLATGKLIWQGVRCRFRTRTSA
jgi:hypothetical protein